MVVVVVVGVDVKVRVVRVVRVIGGHHELMGGLVEMVEVVVVVVGGGDHSLQLPVRGSRATGILDYM